MDSDDVVEIDFIGELVDADLSDWVVVQRDEQAAEVAAAAGGPDSPLLVGPGTLTLDDGVIVTVEANTPGGNYCGLGGPQLGSVCIIVGSFEAGSTTASWFATESAHPDSSGGLPRLSIDGLQADRAFVTAGVSGYFSLPLASDVRFVACGEIDSDNNIADIDNIGGYEGQLGAGDEIVTIHCYGRD